MALNPGNVQRGSVVLVRLPRDKARLAVVVRSNLLGELSYATVLPITTDLRVGASLRIDVAPSEQNGLCEASQVMVDWPQTVRIAEMGAIVGQLEEATMRAITRQMPIVLGIGETARRSRRTSPVTRT